MAGKREEKGGWKKEGGGGRSKVRGEAGNADMPAPNVVMAMTGCQKCGRSKKLARCLLFLSRNIIFAYIH